MFYLSAALVLRTRAECVYAPVDFKYQADHNKLATQFFNYAALKQMLQQKVKLMKTLTVKLSNSSRGQSNVAGGSQSVDHIAGSIAEVLYDPQAHITLDSWYKRYEDLFSVDLAVQDDA
nr:unnamed protein product [Spirometra erinaceieuropaei]